MDGIATGFDDFDLYVDRPLPELQQMYREFRETCPVARSESNGGFWYVTSYDAVNDIARDAVRFSNRRGIVIPPIGGEPLVPLDFDPPEHTKYRAVLQPWLSVPSMRRFDQEIRSMAKSYLAKLESPCDIVTDFALPYALEVITSVLGVPAEMREAMVAFMKTLLGEAGEDPSKAGEAMAAFGGYVQESLINPRRELGPTEDPNDVVDLLVGAQVDGRPLTDAEIRQTVLALLNAGFETTYKSLAACFWYLAGDPDAWEALQTGTVAMGTALEELLRITSPVSVGRTAAQDTEVCGQQIKEGDWVLMMLPAVNRDETQFSNPEALDLSRQPNRHLTFGTGIHRCVGMHLARLELTVALTESLESFGRIWLPEGTEPTFSGSQAAGIVHLPMAFTRR